MLLVCILLIQLYLSLLDYLFVFSILIQYKLLLLVYYLLSHIVF